MEALALIGIGTAFHVYRKKWRKDVALANAKHDDRWMMVAVDSVGANGTAVAAPAGSAAASVMSSIPKANVSNIPAAGAVLPTTNAAGAGSKPPTVSTGIIPAGDAFLRSSNFEETTVNYGAAGTQGAAGTSMAAPSLFAAPLRPSDTGIAQAPSTGGPEKNYTVLPGSEDDGWTMSAMALDVRNGTAQKVGKAEGSSIQILPPVLTGGASEYGYSILQVRRNRTLDLRGDIKPFMPENNPCSLWRSSYAEQAKFNKPITLIHNEVIPMPPTYEQLKNFFSSANNQRSTTATPQSGVAA